MTPDQPTPTATAEPEVQAIPRLVPVDRVRGRTDDPLPKGGDYFGARAYRAATA